MTHLWATRAALRRKGRLASSAVAVAALASSVLLSGEIPAAAAAASAAAPTYAELGNGGFETPEIDVCATYAEGDTALEPWEVTAGEVHLADAACWEGAGQWEPHAGTQSLDLDGTVAGGPGAISQTFSTVEGDDYRVEFWVSGNPTGGPQEKTFTVDAGGEAKEYSFDIGGPTGPGVPMPEYKKMTYEFTASGSSTTLTFTSTSPKDDAGYGAVLDDITVTDVTCNVVGNGGFESPDIPRQTYFEESDTGLAPWEVKSGVVDLIDNAYAHPDGENWAARSGGQSLDLDGGRVGTISQKLTTKEGTDYVVEFWVSGNTGGGEQVKPFTVEASPGGKVKDYSFDIGGPAEKQAMPEYEKMTYEFTATSSSTTLTFASASPEGSGFGAVLDDISACAVPEKAPVDDDPKPPADDDEVPVKIPAGGGPVSGGYGPVSGSDPMVPLVGLVALVAVAGTGFAVRRRRTREQR